jgi:hypothetical protein
MTRSSVAQEAERSSGVGRLARQEIVRRAWSEGWLLKDAAESAADGQVARVAGVGSEIRVDVAARHRLVVAGLGVLEAERRWVAAVLDLAAV